MHHIGINELGNLGKEELRSVDVEEFSTTMQDLHAQVKE